MLNRYLVPVISAISGFLLATVIFTGGALWSQWFSPSLDHQDSPVFATMGSEKLTQLDFQKILNTIDSSVVKRILEDRSLLGKEVRSILADRVILKEAQSKEYDARRDVAFFSERGRDQSIVRHYLGFISKPPKNYPPEQRVRDAYQRNKSKFIVPSSAHLVQIFLKYPEGNKDDSGEKVYKEAENIRALAVKEGADFSGLAKRYSHHKESLEKGGDMGWVSAPKLLPEFKKALDGLKIGDVVVVKAVQGVHVVKLLGVRPESYRSYADVRKALRDALIKNKALEIRKKYLDDLVIKNPVVIQQALIPSFRFSQ